MAKTIPLSKLRIGQRFSWIPRAWYGPGRLTHKTRRAEFSYGRVVTLYDVKFDAAVVNPPGVVYGVPATTRVRLLAAGK